MAKYRKKPVVIEATQFFENTYDGWPLGVYKDSTSPTGFRIDTLEGSHEVTEGDWIITGVKGERYPCKPDIFEATYEPAGNVSTQESMESELYGALVAMQDIMFAEAGVRSVGVDTLIEKYKATRGMKGGA